MQLQFNAATVAPAEPGMAVWEGPVLVQISRTEVQNTKDNNGNRMLILHVVALDGQYRGQENVIRLNLWNSNAQAMDISQRQLSSICHVTGRIQIQDSDQLIGVPFVCVYEKQQRNYTDTATGATKTSDSCQARDFRYRDGATIRERQAGQPPSSPYVAGAAAQPMAQAQPPQQPQMGVAPSNNPQPQQPQFGPPAGFNPAPQGGPPGGVAPAGAFPMPGAQPQAQPQGGQPGFQPQPVGQAQPYGMQPTGQPPMQGSAPSGMPGQGAPGQGYAPGPSGGQPGPGAAFGTAQSGFNPQQQQQPYGQPQQPQGGYQPPHQGGQFQPPAGPQDGAGPWANGAPGGFPQR